MERIEFELVSPEQLLVSQPVHMVVVPGTEGYFGVLSRHIPMITLVGPGVIEMHDENVILDRIFVSGGFCEVTGSRVTVLVSEAVRVKDIDREAAEQALANLKEDYQDAETFDEKEAIDVQVKVAQARVDAAGQYGQMPQNH